MIGFDFDGVVTNGKRPSINDCIITGNTDVANTLDWLSREGIQCAVYFPPKTMKSHDDTAAGVWKSDMIRLLGVTEFYEDKPEQIDIIKSSCPDCKVYKV